MSTAYYYDADPGDELPDWRAGARGLLADLGAEQGRRYSRCAYIGADGTVRIQAGYHHFRLAEARAYWGSAAYPDPRRGAEYLALCDSVGALTRIYDYPI